jgi:hypothetical protein
MAMLAQKEVHVPEGMIQVASVLQGKNRQKLKQM